MRPLTPMAAERHTSINWASPPEWITLPPITRVPAVARQSFLKQWEGTTQREPHRSPLVNHTRSQRRVGSQEEIRNSSEYHLRVNHYISLGNIQTPEQSNWTVFCQLWINKFFSASTFRWKVKVQMNLLLLACRRNLVSPISSIQPLLLYPSSSTNPPSLSLSAISSCPLFKSFPTSFWCWMFPPTDQFINAISEGLLQAGCKSAAHITSIKSEWSGKGREK